jgi:hypothetical protein
MSESNLLAEPALFTFASKAQEAKRQDVFKLTVEELIRHKYSCGTLWNFSTLLCATEPDTYAFMTLMPLTAKCIALARALPLQLTSKHCTGHKKMCYWVEQDRFL